MTSKEIDRVLDLLDSEIKRIAEEEARPGWTRWALVGSLSAILLLLASEVESSPPNAQDVVMLTVLGALLLDVLKSISSVLTPLGRRESSQPRFQLWASYLSEGSLALFARILRAAFLLAAVTMFSLPIPRLAVVLTVVYYLVTVLAGVGSLAFAIAGHPLLIAESLPRSANVSRGVRVGLKTVRPIMIIWLGVGAMATAAFVDALRTQAIPSILSEFRIAGLLVALAEVLVLLSQQRPPKSLYGSLVATRQDLALGRIDLDSARRQTEIALLGMTVSDILQPLVSELLAIDNLTMTEAVAAEKALQQARMVIGKEPSSISNKELREERASWKSYTTHFARMTTAQEQWGESFHRLDQIVQRLSPFAPEATSTVFDEIVDQLVASSDASNQKLSKLDSELASFQTQLETLLAVLDEHKATKPEDESEEVPDAPLDPELVQPSSVEETPQDQEAMVAENRGDATRSNGKTSIS